MKKLSEIEIREELEDTYRVMSVLKKIRALF